jgi:hypothetical protein
MLLGEATPFYCCSFAVERILDRSAGKPTIRPSVSSIKIVLFSAQGLIADGSTVSSLKAVDFIVLLLQELPIFKTNFSISLIVTECTPFLRANLTGSSQNLPSRSAVAT